jgi:hypothetical protein
MAAMSIENPLFQILGDNDAGPEEQQLEGIEDLRPRGGKGARVTLRLPPRLVLYLQGLAQSNGRSFAAECQAALEVHEALSRLSAVLDSDLQARRKAESGGLHGVTGTPADKFAEMLRDDVSRIWSQSFATSTQRRNLAQELFGGDI